MGTLNPTHSLTPKCHSMPCTFCCHGTDLVDDMGGGTVDSFVDMCLVILPNLMTVSNSVCWHSGQTDRQRDDQILCINNYM